jgi:arsenite methyltransferase
LHIAEVSAIAVQTRDDSQSSCCGAGGAERKCTISCQTITNLDGYNPWCRFGLGCGLPTQFAKVKKGDVVIDLGSGAGNNAFIAGHETGETGKVIGIDFTPAMIDKARQNYESEWFHNVEFRQGDIERMPVTANVADVIVSNCVLNLVPDKNEIIKEIYRLWNRDSYCYGKSVSYSTLEVYFNSNNL